MSQQTLPCTIQWWRTADDGFIISVWVSSIPKQNAFKEKPEHFRVYGVRNPERVFHHIH